MIDDQLEDNLGRLRSQVGQFGMKLEQYFQAIGQEFEEVQGRMRGEAEQQVRARLVIANIARMQDFEVTDEELDAELAKIAELYGDPEAGARPLPELNAAQRRVLMDELKFKKAVEYIYENAVVEEAAEEEAEAEGADAAAKEDE
jgi:trigger factor